MIIVYYVYTVQDLFLEEIETFLPGNQDPKDSVYPQISCLKRLCCNNIDVHHVHVVYTSLSYIPDPKCTRALYTVHCVSFFHRSLLSLPLLPMSVSWSMKQGFWEGHKRTTLKSPDHCNIPRATGVLRNNTHTQSTRVHCELIQHAYSTCTCMCVQQNTTIVHPTCRGR